MLSWLFKELRVWKNGKGGKKSFNIAHIIVLNGKEQEKKKKVNWGLFNIYINYCLQILSRIIIEKICSNPPQKNCSNCLHSSRCFFVESLAYLDISLSPIYDLLPFQQTATDVVPNWWQRTFYPCPSGAAHSNDKKPYHVNMLTEYTKPRHHVY